MVGELHPRLLEAYAVRADHVVFTEIDLDKIKHTIGMNITFVTTAETDEQGYALLKRLGMPFSDGSTN